MAHTVWRLIGFEKCNNYDYLAFGWYKSREIAENIAGFSSFNLKER